MSTDKDKVHNVIFMASYLDANTGFTISFLQIKYESLYKAQPEWNHS